MLRALVGVASSQGLAVLQPERDDALSLVRRSYLGGVWRVGFWAVLGDTDARCVQALFLGRLRRWRYERRSGAGGSGAGRSSAAAGTAGGDFVGVVSAAQGRGCRVEVVAFDTGSADLRHECDQFISGYLVPGLLPGGCRPAWVPGPGDLLQLHGQGLRVPAVLRRPRAGNLDPEQVLFHRNDGPPDFDYALLPTRRARRRSRRDAADRRHLCTRLRGSRTAQSPRGVAKGDHAINES